MKGLNINANDTKEIKVLGAILNAINNGGGISSDILSALGGGPAIYNTIEQGDLLSADTITFISGTIHSLSFSVILGSASISFDNGATTITYTAGTNINLEASSTFNQDIIILVSGIASDGDNELIYQTLGV